MQNAFGVAYAIRRGVDVHRAPQRREDHARGRKEQDQGCVRGALARGLHNRCV